jgi:hypothetical protein
MITEKQIISASRRTDIPSFQGKWFLSQVKQGFAEVKNPFRNRYYKVSLKPQEVGAIVFWSKDYRPFLPILDEIDSIYDRRFVFHLTITGFSDSMRKILEPNVPHHFISLATAELLAKKYGAEKLIWRFDPVIFSSSTLPDERLKTFSQLAKSLENITKRCYISFVDLYPKVEKRLSQIASSEGIKLMKPTINEQVEFAKNLKDIASGYGIQVFTCCEDTVGKLANVPKGHCIDVELLQKLFPEIKFTKTIQPTRKECGCYKSKDIGTYNTCRHSCVYCYANR